MPDILGIAAAGIDNSLQQLNTISRNMANVNSQGYKREVYLNRGFQDYLPVAAAVEHDTAQPSLTSHDFSAGPLQFTGSPLNVAIEGRGYFQLQTPQGVVLTRNGQFQLDQRGQLVSPDGFPVLLRGNTTLDNADFKVLSDGTLTVGSSALTQFDLVDAKPESLKVLSPGRYQSIQNEPLQSDSYRIRQGYLEGSNVNSLTEMVDMMHVVRHIETSQQLMRAYDEVIENAISTLGQF